ncbi:MAG TPA: RNA polymerase sigma factor [Gemmatimonadales bacterium]|nr:RNA polymerase sigma factor [Gemmatimonadales bacterium]
MMALQPDGFAALVWRHQNALYRYGRGLGLDHDTALDLVQESFVKAYARLDQCREPDRVRSWLFRIFRNALLDWAKNVRRTEVPLLDVQEPADEEDFGERHALREAIGAALASLPPILREAFLLRHDHGHSYEEIAEIAGTSLSAAKMRVARAREALREALDPDYGNVTSAGSRSS